MTSGNMPSYLLILNCKVYCLNFDNVEGSGGIIGGEIESYTADNADNGNLDHNYIKVQSCSYFGQLQLIKEESPKKGQFFVYCKIFGTKNGGIVGPNYGNSNINEGGILIQNCHAKTDMEGSFCGGLCGPMGSQITNATNKEVKCTVSLCTFIGHLSGSYSGGIMAGGIYTKNKINEPER